MQNHATGGITGTRLGAIPVFQTARLTFGVDTSGTAKKLFTLNGTAARPIWYRILGLVAVPFDGTTATVSVGVVGAGFTDGLNAVDAKAAANTNYSPTLVWKRTVIELGVWAILTLTGGDQTTGQFTVAVEIMDENITEPTAQGG